MTPLSEAAIRAKLIDPAIHVRVWTEDLIKREETAKPVEIVNRQARRGVKGRTDYTLRVRVNAESEPVAVALIEAERAAPDRGPSDAGRIARTLRTRHELQTHRCGGETTAHAASGRCWR